MRLILHAAWVLILTFLTQLGGVAWLMALPFRRRWLAFPTTYAALWIMALLAAPLFGRVPMDCWSDGPLRVQSPLYCALNRQYLDPELLQVAQDLARDMDGQFPGTVTLALDANFPFFDGFPMMPHLSHKDGEKLDLAFWYERDGQYLPGQTKSSLGYFAFEQGPTDCPPTWLTLRWDMGWLQGLWPDWTLNRDRTIAALRWLIRDGRVQKVFVEPHLRQSLGLSDAKLRFQGCRAARHDDHIHLQL
jgi:hypothetical protein